MTSTLIRQLIDVIPVNLDFKVTEDGILITGFITESCSNIPLIKETTTKPKYNIPQALVNVQNELTNKLTLEELDELIHVYSLTKSVKDCYPTKASKKIFRIAGKQADSIIEQFIKLNI